jgi:adenosine deaminase
MLFALAARNRVGLPYADVDAVRTAYVFEDLQSFLDIYYAGCAVLLSGQDFFDLTVAYLERAATEGVRHAEIFFDPQTHTDRGVPFGTVVDGISEGLGEGRRSWGISSRLILCFLRHLSAAAAMATLEEALPHRDRIDGVGLDSAELGHPPSVFAEVFQRARGEGFAAVAHAGEEGPPGYVWEALDQLQVVRIDHGVRSMEDPALVDRLVSDQVPLTVCPLSNVKLRVVPDLEHHPLATMLRRGLRVTANSDDPAYFGGYVADNLTAVAVALDLDRREVHQLARNSFLSSWLYPTDRDRQLAALDHYVEGGTGAAGPTARGGPAPPRP